MFNSEEEYDAYHAYMKSQSESAACTSNENEKVSSTTAEMSTDTLPF